MASERAGLSTEEGIEIFKKGYTPIAEYAEQHDFKLVMEIWPGWGQNLARSPELFRALFEAVPSPSLGLSLDHSHLVMQGIDYIKATKEFGAGAGDPHRGVESNRSSG